MPRQLFTDDTRVSKRGGGAVPFSMAVHAAVVGGLLVLGGDRIAETQPEPPRPVLVLARENPAPAGPKTEAPPAAAPKVVRRTNTQRAPIVAPTSEPFVAPADNIETFTNESDLPLEPYAPPTEPCPDCAIGEGDPVADGPGVPGGEGGGGDGGPIRLSEVEAPLKIRHVQPVYPPHAIHLKLEGAVRLDCVIGPDGRIRDARVLEGPFLLRDAALTAVKQWIYNPPRLSGQPVSVILSVTVRFHLR
jgi:TonB family protein